MIRVGAATTYAQPNLSALKQASALAREVFDRFQDGPIYAQADCLPSIDKTTNGTLKTGDFCLLSIGTWPNPALNARGGSRIMQVISRWEHPAGPTFRLLDVGPNLQATSAPTVA